ncbi:hypothetical protein GCM10010401_22200 [Rarobacter faecitabidus]
MTGTLANIQVTGTWGFRPEVAFTPPLMISEPDDRVLIQGAGSNLKEGGKALLQIYAVSASNGDVLRDDFATVPQTYRVTTAALGEDLYDVVLGRRTGSRLVHITYDSVPIIMIIDILPLKASGTKVDPPAATSSDGAALPTVVDNKVVIPDSDPPRVLTTSMLILGNGVQMSAGQTAVLQYQAVRWSNGKVVGTTWDADTLPVTVKVGSDALIEGLDAALTDVTVGSRMLVIVPPGLAFGLTDSRWRRETMVYLIDVLAASTADAAEDQGAETENPADAPQTGDEGNL